MRGFKKVMRGIQDEGIQEGEEEKKGTKTNDFSLFSNE
jgi:hypothetical protein